MESCRSAREVADPTRWGKGDHGSLERRAAHGGWHAGRPQAFSVCGCDDRHGRWQIGTRRTGASCAAFGVRTDAHGTSGTETGRPGCPAGRCAGEATCPGPSQRRGTCTYNVVQVSNGFPALAPNALAWPPCRESSENMMLPSFLTNKHERLHSIFQGLQLV